MPGRIRGPILFILCILVSVSGGVSPLRAGDVTVVTETWEPYNFEKQGRVTGICTEIVERSLATAGVGLTGPIRIYPWPRAYKMALEGRNTLIYTILRTPERESLFKWIGPIIPSDRFYLFARKGSPGKGIRSLNQAGAFQIGVLRDSIHEEFMLRSGVPDAAIQPVSDQALNLKKLLAGRVDFIVDTESSLKIRAEQMGLDPGKFEKILFLFENGYYMAFGPNSDDGIVSRIRKAFAALEKAGVVQEILQKY